MRKSWRRTMDRALADELRARRPEPSAELVRSLAARIEADRQPIRRRAFRPALAVSFTALLLVAFGVFGGAGYASSVTHQVTKVVHVFTVSPNAPTGAGNALVAAQKSGTSNDNATGSSKHESEHGDKGHHGRGGDDDDDGGDDDQYKPGKGCGDKNHVHSKHNECHGHHRHGGRH